MKLTFANMKNASKEQNFKGIVDICFGFHVMKYDRKMMKTQQEAKPS